MSCQIDKSYALAALLINSTNQEVTAEKIAEVFQALNKKDFSNKIASMFCMSADKYKELMTCTGSSSGSVAAPSAAVAKVEEEEPETEKSESESIALDF